MDSTRCEFKTNLYLYMKPKENSFMDMVDSMPLGKKRVASAEGSIDTFPEDVIGIILSHMDSARNLVMASSTCHKWHEASIHHLKRLAFVESDFSGKDKDEDEDVDMELYMREIIITKAVMKTSSLCELSIWMDRSFELQPASVVAWLLHTKKTLKSLTFGNCTKPRLNILETLGAKVEHLHWHFAYIPTIDPTTRSFKSLVSLELLDTHQLTAENLKVLLIACPKLENLYFSNIAVLADGTGLLELQTSSLKVLSIFKGLNGINALVLHAESLEDVRLLDINLELFKLVQGKGNHSLRYLSIDGTHIAQLDFGEAANSLLDLEIYGTRDLTAEWPKYYEVISSASNLKNLKLHAVSLDMRNSIDIHKIAISFPHLHFLALNYENAWEGFTSHESGLFPIFEKLCILELFCHQIREGFVQWIARLLEQSPSLKQLKICVDHVKFYHGSGDRRLSRFMSSMVQIVRLYPLVDVSFDFSC